MPEGLEAIVFTADGDMRQGLNNLQARDLCAVVQLSGAMAGALLHTVLPCNAVPAARLQRQLPQHAAPCQHMP